jgi:hypothetical protein
MAELRATPMSNPILGLLADRLKKAQQFGAKPFGYENPPVEMLMNLLGVPAVQQTMERMAYGEPLTTGSGMTTKPRPEAIEAAMTLLPASVGLAKATKGLPVGASIENVGKDLSAINIGDRTIPVTINRIDKKSGGQLVNVNPSAFDEAFSKTGWQYVGEKGKDGISGRYEKFENYLKDAKSIEASNVSVNKDGGIVFGDGRHRYAVLRDMGLDELPIVMDKESIKNAKKFGYLADSPKNPIAPRQEALDTTQKNAALPVEEGLLSVQTKQPMQGLLQSKIPSPSSLTMPDVPTIEQMQKYGRTEIVPLSKAVSFQSVRTWDKFNKGEHAGDLVQGFGDKPLALRLENGEYIIYDGNHRTDLAMQAGKTELPMNVIDVKSYDPSNAGRKPVPPSMSDDELLRSLLE